jgi:hypothetical protein
LSRDVKGELENNSRKPRDLVRNWHSDSLKVKRINLLFLQVRRSREMKFKMKMIKR